MTPRLQLVTDDDQTDGTPASIEENAGFARRMLHRLAGGPPVDTETVDAGKCDDCGRSAPERYTIGTFKCCQGCVNRRNIAGARQSRPAPALIIAPAFIIAPAPQIRGACQLCSIEVEHLAPLDKIFACDSCIRHDQQGQA